MPYSISRRTILGASGVAGVSAALPIAPAWASDDSHRRQAARLRAEAKRAEAAVRAGWKSSNGWDAERGVEIGGSIWGFRVPGTPVTLALNAVVAPVLVNLVSRFHYEVQAIETPDVIGWIAPWLAHSGHEGTHASGTAVDILPGSMPRGSTEGLSPRQRRAVRAILEDLDGVVAWRGDSRPADSSHFHIAVGPADPKLQRTIDAIELRLEGPGTGVLSAS